MNAYLDRVSTAVAPNDVHNAFVAFAHEPLVQRSGAEHRRSVRAPAA